MRSWEWTPQAQLQLDHHGLPQAQKADQDRAWGPRERLHEERLLSVLQGLRHSWGLLLSAGDQLRGLVALFAMLLSEGECALPQLHCSRCPQEQKIQTPPSCCGLESIVEESTGMLHEARSPYPLRSIWCWFLWGLQALTFLYVSHWAQMKKRGRGHQCSQPTLVSNSHILAAPNLPHTVGGLSERKTRYRNVIVVSA